jgi:hypothetical protein
MGRPVLPAATVIVPTLAKAASGRPAARRAPAAAAETARVPVPADFSTVSTAVTTTITGKRKLRVSLPSWAIAGALALTVAIGVVAAGMIGWGSVGWGAYDVDPQVAPRPAAPVAAPSPPPPVVAKTPAPPVVAGELPAPVADELPAPAVLTGAQPPIAAHAKALRTNASDAARKRLPPHRASAPATSRKPITSDTHAGPPDPDAPMPIMR